MRRSESFLISMAEPLGYLRSCYHRRLAGAMEHDHTAIVATNFGAAAALHTRQWNLDVEAYLAQLVQEICEMGARGMSVGGVPESTKLLVKAGFDWETAFRIAADMFALVTDEISLYLPGATFSGSPQWCYALVDSGDLMATLRGPYKGEENTK